MDLYALELRQSITTWRDQTILDCAEILNLTAIESRRQFEARLHNAGPIDIIWDPAAYAAQEIDQSMNDQCAALLVERLLIAGSELAKLDSKLIGLGNALGQSAATAWLPVATASKRPSVEEPSRPVPKSESSRLAGLRVSAAELGNRATDLLAQAAEGASRALKDRTVLHNRLRSAATKHLKDNWMNFTGSPRPVLAQILLMVDETAAQARMMQ